jgi:hypothetical protein
MNAGTITHPQTENTSRADLLTLCKLLLDEERLQILGVLAQGPCSQVTLAQRLPTVGKLGLHLHRLSDAGLLTRRGDLYALDLDAIHLMKRTLFARAEGSVEQTPADKELAKFIKGGQLVQLPVQPAKLLLVLTWLVENFQPGVAYTEREVNELLRGHAVDHVTLRRLLIDHLLLTRQAGIYRRQEPG